MKIKQDSKNQSTFSTQPLKKEWYRRWDLNPHTQRVPDFESSASAIPPLRLVYVYKLTHKCEKSKSVFKKMLKNLYFMLFYIQDYR